jgi:hypothetical protein
MPTVLRVYLLVAVLIAFVLLVIVGWLTEDR